MIIDDFVLCFQYRAEALRVQEVLRKRLAKFSLTLAGAKTKLADRAKKEAEANSAPMGVADVGAGAEYA